MQRVYLKYSEISSDSRLPITIQKVTFCSFACWRQLLEIDLSKLLKILAEKGLQNRSYWTILLMVEIGRSFFGLNLGGGFNPSQKYESNWIISPSRGEHKKYFETTTQSIYLRFVTKSCVMAIPLIPFLAFQSSMVQFYTNLSWKWVNCHISAT